MTNRAEIKLNYPTEQTEDEVQHRSGYQGAEQETHLEAANEHMVSFKAKLDVMEHNETVTTYGMRDDLGEHRLQARREIVNCYVEAFNSPDFNGNEKERLHAVQDVPQTVFEPLRQYVETHQLQVEYNVDPETVRKMEEAGITHLERVPTGDNANFNFVFQADDKFANELVEHTGGQA